MRLKLSDIETLKYKVWFDFLLIIKFLVKVQSWLREVCNFDSDLIRSLTDVYSMFL